MYVKIDTPPEVLFSPTKGNITEWLAELKKLDRTKDVEDAIAEAERLFLEI